MLYVTRTPGNNGLTAARMLAAARRADARQMRRSEVVARDARLASGNGTYSDIVSFERQHEYFPDA